MMSKQTFNVLMLSFGFLILFIPFQTLSNILKTILDSLKTENQDYDTDPQIALAIVYVVFSLTNFIAPSVVGIAGPRLSIFLGSITYLTYVSSFFIVLPYTLYIASIISGFGAAIIWTAQGTYLTQNSDITQMGRNSGIFWAIFQCSFFLGNLYVFFTFQGKKNIDADTRNQLYLVFTIVSVIGVLILATLRPSVDSSGELVKNVNDGVFARIKVFVNSFRDTKLLVLLISFWFTGVSQTYGASIHGVAIAKCRKIADDPTKYNGMSGVLYGLGEVVGGALFGILGKKTVVWGRTPVILLGAISFLASYVLIFLNLPDNASYVTEPTEEQSYFGNPILWIALLCSYLLGFGDACFQTQIYSIIGCLYCADSAPAYSVFKFAQSIACALSFVYSKGMGIHFQMMLLAVQVVLAFIAFAIVEFKYGRNSEETPNSENLPQTSVESTP